MKRFLVLPLATALGLIASCANQNHLASPIQPGSGVEEYRQLTSESTIAVLSALRSLELVNAQRDRCPPKTVDIFVEEVEQLQIKSLKVRSRAQAIQARGEAYFGAWAKAPEGDSSKAPEYSSELKASFSRAKLASQHVGDTFRPFLAGLRMLRGELLNDSSALQSDKAKELVRTTREHGLQVLQKLGALTDELHELRRRLLAEKHEPSV